MGETIKLMVSKNKEYVSVSSVVGELAVAAVSPKVSFEKVEGGTRLDITDVDGTKSTVLPDGAAGPEGPVGPAGEPGERGEPGPAGKDGVSPTASVTQTETGAIVTVTDGSGTTTATLENGKNGAAGRDGSDGEPGKDGFSPTVQVQDIEGGHRVIITSAEGTTTVDVMDGAEGPAGPQGETGPAGSPGVSGKDGADGVTFTPDVQSEGVISWTNDGGRTNPQSVNIRGPQGESGAMVVESVSGTDPVITGVDNHRYMCGTVDTLTLTPPASGIVDVVFTSGTTPTVLSVTPPSGKTMLWPGWFNPSALDASTVYEINIMDGVYGTVMAWT